MKEFRRKKNFIFTFETITWGESSQLNEEAWNLEAFYSGFRALRACYQASVRRKKIRNAHSETF